MGLFEDIMEGFFKIFGAIARAIRGVFVVVAGIIEWFGTEILPTIAFIFAAVFISVGLLGLFAPALATSIVHLLVYGVSVVQGGTALMINAGPIAVKTAMVGLRAVLATFLEAIHFRTIMALHNIAWVLSEDYRKMLSKVFKKMSEASEVIFGWSLGMRVIIENTRSIVITSAAALGFEYDTAQLMWITSFSEIIEKINEKSEIYMEDPEQFFFDLEEMVDKHAIDLSSGASRLIYEATYNQTVAIERTATILGDVQAKSNQNRHNVNVLSGQNLDRRVHYNQATFMGFQTNTYAPKQQQQDSSIEENSTQTENNRNSISMNAQKLSEPDGQIKGVDKQPEPEKTEQEESLEDLTTRPFQEDTEELAEEQKVANEDREDTLSERETEIARETEPAHVPTKPVTPLEVKPKPTVNAWSVGDF